MTIVARCDGCRREFEVDDDRAGGFAPCPGCGRATPVEGLRDPYYRLVQLVGLAALAVCVAAVIEFEGWAAGLAALVGGVLALRGLRQLL